MFNEPRQSGGKCSSHFQITFVTEDSQLKRLSVVFVVVVVVLRLVVLVVVVEGVV